MTLKLLDVLAAGRIYGSTLDEVMPIRQAPYGSLGARRHRWRHEIVADCAKGAGKAHVSAGPRLPPWGG
jgi:hypothetical protein